MANTEALFKMFTADNRSGYSSHENVDNSDHSVNDEALRVMEIIFYVVLCGLLGLLGSFANVINIIIFCKQGFNESVNISLVGLASSDLGILIPLVWTSICYTPIFRYSNIDFDSVEVEFLTAGVPNAGSVRITSWIVAFITFERCVCIAFPMKVKVIITPKRALIAVVAIYFLTCTTGIPYLCYVYLAPYFHPERNRTIVGVKFVVNDTALLNVCLFFIVVAQLISFIIVIICSVVLIFNLQIKSQWRRKVTSASNSSQTNSLSSRDKRVIKMVVTISCTFIACNLPGAVNMILMLQLYPEYAVDGRYYYSYNISSSVITTLEAINSSINIFIYYNMSSKFRQISKRLFRIRSVDAKST